MHMRVLSRPVMSNSLQPHRKIHGIYSARKLEPSIPAQTVLFLSLVKRAIFGADLNCAGKVEFISCVWMISRGIPWFISLSHCELVNLTSQWQRNHLGDLDSPLFFGECVREWRWN